MAKTRCQRKRNGEAHASSVLRGAMPSHNRPAASASVGGNQAAQRLLSQSGRGQPLADSGRRFFEPRFGQSLEHVRVHNDAAAHQSARALHARAFTSGNDIVFANQQYAPETQGGKSLLAHELAHTIQQKTPSAPAVQRTCMTTNACCRTETTDRLSGNCSRRWWIPDFRCRASESTESSDPRPKARSGAFNALPD